MIQLLFILSVSVETKLKYKEEEKIMNILENYIEEIHSVKPHIAEWTKEFPDRDFLEVDVTTNCYGRTERKTHVWTVKEWEVIQAQGYYWG